MKTQYDYRDIEAQKEEKEKQKIALKKNNEELDRICNEICLVFGWCSVFWLFGYLIFLIIIK